MPKFCILDAKFEIKKNKKKNGGDIKIKDLKRQSCFKFHHVLIIMQILLNFFFLLMKIFFLLIKIVFLQNSLDLFLIVAEQFLKGILPSWCVHIELDHN